VREWYNNSLLFIFSMKTAASQLCAFYLDGNDETAFEAFESGGPRALLEFLGFRGSSAAWKHVYKVLLDDYAFLDRLCAKYHVFMGDLIRERGIDTFRDVLQISDGIFDTSVVRVWERLLDGMFDRTMQRKFSERRKSHFGTFFTGLRNMLRREIGL